MGDAQALASAVALQGYKVTLDPGDRIDIAISDVIASRFVPDDIYLIILGTGTITDWTAKQKKPDAVFVTSLDEAVKKLQETRPIRKAEEPAGGNPHPLVLTYSNKGGVGKTTAAVSIALTLANAGVKTLLCDFDFAAPDIATYFNLNPKKGIEGIADNPELLKAADNLWILPGPATPEIPNITSDTIVRAIRGFQDSFQVIVGDTPPAPWEKTNIHGLFGIADKVYAIVDQSKYSVRETETYAPTLLMMGVDPSNIRIVVNRYSPKLASLREIERAFCSGFKKSVKNLPRISAAIPDGWEKHVTAGYNKEILHQEEWVKLAREITGQNLQLPVNLEKKKGGLLDWLRKKR